MLLPFVGRWARASQLGSRRNAMVATTAMAQRRAERQVVEDFFASREVGPEPVTAPRETQVTAAAR